VNDCIKIFANKRNLYLFDKDEIRGIKKVLQIKLCMKKDKVVYFHHQCLFLCTCGKGCINFIVKFLWFYIVLVIFKSLKITCVKYNHDCGFTAKVYKNIFI